VQQDSYLVSPKKFKYPTTHVVPINSVSVKLASQVKYLGVLFYASL